MEGWRNYVARFSSLLVTGVILSACYAPTVTPTQSEIVIEPFASEVIETEVPTLESTLTNTPIPSPTFTPRPPPVKVDMETLELMASEWPSTDLYSVEQITFGDLLSISSKVYSGAGGSEATVEDGLLSHLAHQGIIPGDKYPEMDEIIKGPMDVYLNLREDLEGLGVVLIPPTPTPILIHPKGKVVTHHKNQETGFEWFSYVPNSMKLNDDVIIVINGFQCCCEEEQIGSTKGWLNNFSHYAEEYKFVFLFPAIPKNCPGESQGLDRWSYHYPKYIFTTNPDYPFYRIDLKLNAMIDELMKILKEDGYDVHSKVFMFGYSIDSHHANRYSLIHPERVEAFAAGGTAGEISLPFDSLDGSPLNWWFGIANIEHLTKKPFNSEAYNDINQFFFWGEQDLANYHLEEGCRYEGGAFCRWYYYWGDDLVTALREQCSFLQDKGLNVVCKEYQGLAHDFYDTMRDDVFKLFDEIRREKLGK